MEWFKEVKFPKGTPKNPPIIPANKN